MSEKLLRLLVEGKLLITFLSMCFAFLLAILGILPPDAYVTVAIAIPVAFITGSVFDNKISHIQVAKE